MRILVLGGSGLAGSALVRVLSGLGHNVFAPTRAEYDIIEGPLPLAFLTGRDAAINAAVLKLPADRGAAWRVNAEFPQELARLCAGADVKLIHISTDGVFSGRAGAYDEDAEPDPDDDYGAQKLAGEPSFGLVLRTSIIGPERRGFHSLLCWLLAQEGEAPGYIDQLWNGVSSLALARSVAKLIAEEMIPTGVRHIFSDDVSKHELLTRLSLTFGCRLSIAPVRAPIARDRRLRSLYPEFLAACALPPLNAQLAELPALVDERGGWRDAL